MSPLGGSCFIALKWACCRSSDLPPSSSTIWTPRRPLLTYWVTANMQQCNKGSHDWFSSGSNVVSGPVKWDALCSYLCLPSNLLQLYHSQHTLLDPLILGYTHTQTHTHTYWIDIKGKRWCDFIKRNWWSLFRHMCVFVTDGALTPMWGKPCREVESWSGFPESPIDWSICQMITAFWLIRLPISRQSAC